MKLFKLFLNLTMALSLFVSQTSAAAVTGRSPGQMMDLFDEYLQHVSSTQKGDIWLEYGRQKYLARGVIAEAATLEPEDFNVFNFLLMERYVNKPAEREYIVNFLAATSTTLAADLKYSRALQEGPAAFMLEGAYQAGSIFLILASIGFRMALSRNTRGLADLMLQVRQRQVAAAAINKYYGFAYKVGTSPAVWLTGASSAIGAGVGLGWFGLQNWGTHRFNPMILLLVTQVNIACHLSYLALGVQDEFEKIKDKPEQLGQHKADLLARIQDIRAQSKALLETKSLFENEEQNLESLDARDRLFAKILDQYPKAESWQKFRSSLTEGETSQNGLCRQMSLKHLDWELDRTAAIIDGTFAIDPPAVPEKK